MIHAWLFATQPLSDYPQTESVPEGGELFAEKLISVMELADISNQRLAKELRVDSPVTSKYRSGLRSLHADSPRITEISAVLAPRILALGRIESLSQLIGVSEEELGDESVCARYLETWLREFKTTDNALLESFLNEMDNYLPGSVAILPPEEAAGDAANDTNTEYVGIGGLRRAVLRFLYAAIRDKKPRLLLYSDQNMGWMVGDCDYTVRWISLMVAYAACGARSKSSTMSSAGRRNCLPRSAPGCRSMSREGSKADTAPSGAATGFSIRCFWSRRVPASRQVL